MQTTSYAPIVVTIQNLYNNQMQTIHLNAEQVQILREALLKSHVYLAEAITRTAKIQDNRVLVNG